MRTRVLAIVAILAAGTSACSKPAFTPMTAEGMAALPTAADYPSHPSIVLLDEVEVRYAMNDSRAPNIE